MRKLILAIVAGEVDERGNVISSSGAWAVLPGSPTLPLVAHGLRAEDTPAMRLTLGLPSRFTCLRDEALKMAAVAELIGQAPRRLVLQGDGILVVGGKPERTGVAGVADA